MIPKIVHYCWFGGNKKTKLIEDCISSWRRYLPDYVFFEWNETNVDLDARFVKKAYKLKKWAFVSDYIRLQKIYEYGGVYLDVDMIVLKNLDPLLQNSLFFGTENSSYINAAIIGSIPKHRFVAELLNQYKYIKMNNYINLFDIAIPKILTKTFREYYLFNEDFSGFLEYTDVKIYPTEYFYSFGSGNSNERHLYDKYTSDSSFTVHLWGESWIEPNEFENIRKRKFKKAVYGIIKTFKSEKKINRYYIRKIFSALKESMKN